MDWIPEAAAPPHPYPLRVGAELLELVAFNIDRKPEKVKRVGCRLRDN
jgi:hypothetical protein